jgi:predicted RND superfamily exporter protein
VSEMAKLVLVGVVLALLVVLLVTAAVGVAVWLVDKADGRRHQHLDLKLEQMRQVTLQAIGQRQRIESKVADHAEVLEEHADLLDELRPQGPRARRPNPFPKT